MDPELTLNFDSLQDETDGGINNSEIPSSKHEEERQPEINKEEKDKKTTEIISKKCNLNKQQKWRLLKYVAAIGEIRLSRHFFLIVWTCMPPGSRLVVKRIGVTYAHYFNKKYERDGRFVWSYSETEKWSLEPTPGFHWK